VGTPDPWSLNSWIRTALGSDTGEEYAEWYEDPEHEETASRDLSSEEASSVDHSSSITHSSFQSSSSHEEESWTEYEMDALESLEVSSNLIPLETSLYLAQRFGGRVKSLAVLGSVKSQEFVKELLRVLGRSQTRIPFSQPDDVDLATSSSPPNPNDATTLMIGTNWNLRTLKLGPVQLSPELLDLLAHNLPNLQHLELIVKHFLPSQDDVPIYAASRHHHGRSNTAGGNSGGGGGAGEGDGVQLDEQVVRIFSMTVVFRLNVVCSTNSLKRCRMNGAGHGGA
jgi:hypothetical protein